MVLLSRHSGSHVALTYSRMHVSSQYYEVPHWLPVSLAQGDEHGSGSDQRIIHSSVTLRNRHRLPRFTRHVPPIPCMSLL
jgi:hypothetical protein